MSTTQREILPTEVALLPLRRGVLFPNVVMSLPIGRKRTLALIKSLKPGDIFGVAFQRDPKVGEPVIADLHTLGAYARLRQVTFDADGRSARIAIEGIARMEIGSLVQSDPHWRANVRPVSDVVEEDDETKFLFQDLRAHARDIAEQWVPGLGEVVMRESNPGDFVDHLIGTIDVDANDKLEVFLLLDVKARLHLAAKILNEAKSRWELRARIGSEVRRELNEEQRKMLLRQQLRAIQRELGDNEDGDENDKLAEKLDRAQLSEEAREVADRELTRLAAMGQNNPEAMMLRRYLEWLGDMPWQARADVHEDIDRAAAKLEADHHGLEEVKRRILEHLAVAKLSGRRQGTILCLAGPPGVGKTSLGRSIADATGRPFIRVSLGGVRDEAEIRGHRRTYVGALPGRIIAALRKAKVNNPVIMLDEIDKLGHGWAGDPEAALLEVLDPEQNATFTDHYLEVPFDLSEVMFIATANTLDTISPPLRDRLEIIDVAGYIPEEKVQIARKHLWPKQLERHGIALDSVLIDDALFADIVRDYTREAGVRQLDRQIQRLCRGLALTLVRKHDHEAGDAEVLTLDLAMVRTHLGKPKFHNEVAERVVHPGIATGLAWTPVGGDILFIETSKMPGKGNLQITGKLGEVMQESARAALTYVRSHGEELGLKAKILDEQDIHIHVPAGAVPKDGPSAGVTIFTALVSLLTGRKVRSDTAMTGECSLRGRVLPVGGIKEKVMAAHRAGLTRVILPRRNERDLDDVPASTREALEFVLVDDMGEALDAALEQLPMGMGTRVEMIAS